MESDVTRHCNSELACGHQEITVANSRTDGRIGAIMPIPDQSLEPLAASVQILEDVGHDPDNERSPNTNFMGTKDPRIDACIAKSANPRNHR